MSISASAAVRIMGEAGRPLIDNYWSLIPVSLADGRRDRRARDLQIPIRCETTRFLKVFCGGILSDLETRKATLEKKLLWYWIRVWTRSSLFISYFKIYISVYPYANCLLLDLNIKRALSLGQT